VLVDHHVGGPDNFNVYALITELGLFSQQQINRSNSFLYLITKLDKKLLFIKSWTERFQHRRLFVFDMLLICDCRKSAYVNEANCSLYFTALVRKTVWLVFQDDTVDCAMAFLQEKQITQPVLFRVQSRYFVKADSTAIPIPDCSFVDAVEFLFMCYFVFHVSYPADLRLFYGFVENVLGMKSSIGKSSTLAHLLRTLTNLANSRQSEQQ
jgi:hypothetical protein